MKYFYWILAIVILAGLWYYLSVQRSPAPSPGQTQEISVYFNKSEPTEIVQVAVKRTIADGERDTEALAAEALNELLKGPTDEEKTQGLSTAIAGDCQLNYVKIENGVATADFCEKFDYQVGGSARVLAIRAQVEKTLKQFPEISEVKMTVEGEREAVLEP